MDAINSKHLIRKPHSPNKEYSRTPTITAHAPGGDFRICGLRGQGMGLKMNLDRGVKYSL